MPSLVRLAASSFALTSLVALVACSGAKPQLVEEAPASPAAASSADDAGNVAAPSGDDDDTSSGSSSGGNVSTPTPAGCPENSIIETGGNDTRGLAIEFTNIACGTVKTGGDDWWKFTLPSNAKKLTLDYSGKVTLQVTVAGDTLTVGPGTVIPFHAGAEYAISVTSATGHTQDYVLDMEDQ